MTTVVVAVEMCWRIIEILHIHTENARTEVHKRSGCETHAVDRRSKENKTKPGAKKSEREREREKK